MEILSKETNSYAEFYLQSPLVSTNENYPWTPTTPSEIHLHFGLYPLAVREDYWKMHKLGQFMGYGRFKRIRRFFRLNDENTVPPPLNAPWFHRIQRIAALFGRPVKNALFLHPILRLTKQWWPSTTVQKILSSSRANRLIQATNYGVSATMATFGAGYFTPKRTALRLLKEAGKPFGNVYETNA